MFIAELKLKNFKRFESQTIDLGSNITLLLGPNSSGKTSIIKSILGLKQSVSPSNEHEVLATQGDYVDLGTYKDLVYKHDTKLPVTIDFMLDSISKVSYLITNFNKYKIRYAITYQLDYHTEQARIENITITLYSKSDGNEVGNLQLEKKKTVSNGYWLHISESILTLLKQGGPYIETEIENPISVRHEERFRFYAVSHKVRTSFTAFDLFNDLISVFTQGFEREVFYLGPLRTSPARSYTRTSHSLAVGPTGEHTPSVLANLEKKNQLARSEKSEAKNNYEVLLKWVASMFPGKTILTKKYEELVKLKVLSTVNHDIVVEDTITDVGFGFSQIIPILVQSAVMPYGSTLIIEQPELHLHPMAQANLATVIASAATMGKRFIIETHSEHFLRGLQLQISKHKSGESSGLPSEFLKILYVADPPGPVNVLETNEWGELTSKMPSGFFDEAYKLAFQLMQNKSKSLSVKKGE